MNLWRLEWLRLTRTGRWLVLGGAYVFFGVTGPLTARYLQDIVSRFGSGVQLTVPPPTPVEGLAEYVANASQLGLLAVLAIAAASFAFDVNPESAAFLRTRVSRVRQLLTPRYALVTAAATASYATGMLVAWLITAQLIGAPPTSAILWGTVLGAVYLAFGVAVVAAASGFSRGVVGMVLMSAGVLIGLPVLAVVPRLAPWMPSELVAAGVEIGRGTSPVDFLRATVVSVAATAALLRLAVWRHASREL